MTYKTIIVYFNKPERAKSLLDAATHIAELHGAHLTGLYVVPPIEYHASSDIPVPLEITKKHDELNKQNADRIKTMFKSATENQTYAAEWCYADTRVIKVVETVSSFANTAELLLLSQSDESDVNTLQKEFPENVLMATSRPVLMVPATSSFSGLGKNIFVAFDGSKESTRAVFDAMPLLKMADSVAVHQVNPSEFERHHVLGTSSELIRTLCRQNVEAVLSQSSSKRARVGEELMQVAREKGSDLIVMGAYGHHRLREKLFGGTTQTLLKKMQVPVLMSC